MPLLSCGSSKDRGRQSTAKQEDGPFEEYRFNGQLYKKGAYKDGKLDGLYEKYFENGQLWKKGPFKDGRYHGPFETYYPNGQVSREANFREGKFHGPFVSYWDDGKLQKKGTYDMNRMCGEWFDLGKTQTPPPCPPSGTQPLAPSVAPSP